MLETKNIKAPGLYKTASLGVIAFEEKVKEIYSEMKVDILRKAEAGKTTTQLNLELQQIQNQYRKETNKARRAELEVQTGKVLAQLEAEKEHADLDLVGLLSQKLSESGVYELEEVAREEQQAYTTELRVYDKAIRKAFNDSIKEVTGILHSDRYKEGKRLLEAIEATIQKG